MKNTLIITFLLGLTACAGSSGGGSAATPTVCDQSGLVGTWKATLSGGGIETLAINSSCVVTSDHCGSTSQITVSSVDTSTCNASASTCGNASFAVQTSNNVSGCVPVGTYNCTYAVASDKSYFQYNCGGSTYQYNK